MSERKSNKELNVNAKLVEGVFEKVDIEDPAHELPVEELSKEQQAIIEAAAQVRYIAATTDSHAAVMEAQKVMKSLTKIAKSIGVKSIAEASVKRYLELIYDEE